MLKFTIPFLPPSLNCTHTFSSSVVNGKVRMKVEQTAQARRWKSEAKFYMPKFTFDPDKVYEFRLRLCGNWLTKADKPKDKDARNHAELALEATLERYGIGRLGKLVTDAIFDHYKQSDRVIWVDRIEKVQSTSERVEVEVVEVER